MYATYGYTYSPVLFWMMQFILGYLLVEAFCDTGLHFKILGVNGLDFILFSITLMAAISSGYLVLQWYRNWGDMHKGKRFKERFLHTGQWSEEALEFIYLTGFLLSTLFPVTVLAVGLPLLFLRTCG